MTAELLDRLRVLERGGECVIETCSELVDIGEWRPVLVLGEKLLRVSQVDCVGCNLAPDDKYNPGDLCYVLDSGCWEERRKPQLARHAANILRLLAPVAGHRGRPVDSCWDGCASIRTPDNRPHTRGRVNAPPVPCKYAIPNPFPLYVEALRVWRPRRWFEWLSDRMAVIPHKAQWQWRSSTATSLVWEVRGYRARIRRDGKVQCGSRCPELPEIPEDGAKKND